MVVSNNTFNHFVRTAAMVCPITSTDRGIPIHVRLNGRTKTTGVVMCDQAKTKTWDIQKRNADFIEHAPEDVIFEVTDMIGSFVEVEK